MSCDIVSIALHKKLFYMLETNGPSLQHDIMI